MPTCHVIPRHHSDPGGMTTGSGRSGGRRCPDLAGLGSDPRGSAKNRGPGIAGIWESRVRAENLRNRGPPIRGPAGSAEGSAGGRGAGVAGSQKNGVCRGQKNGVWGEKFWGTKKVKKSRFRGRRTPAGAPGPREGRPRFFRVFLVFPRSNTVCFFFSRRWSKLGRQSL